MTMPEVDWPALVAHPDVQRLIDLALHEDVGPGDLTSEALFPQPQRVRGQVIARSATVVCGVPLAAAVLARFDPNLALGNVAVEGAVLGEGATLFAVESEARALLTAERTVLNFLSRLCGIAAGARAAMAKLAPGSAARLYDTRKTTPGWRRLEKAAVRTGGADNHRLGLYDAYLIKDNHIAVLGSVGEAVRRARAARPEVPVEVEIDRLDQLQEAIAAGAAIVLCDNFSDADLTAAVKRAAGKVELEASGGITLERLPGVSKTGVTRISMGGLTYAARPADLSLEVTP